ncbi:MAG: hypothetical protein KatS3mg111_2107 [Pirellulaceae bacterium]|nr:MAG: hypothetical protein KatS3mg111_2107 [Pirellulaceae bacterium]
MGRPKRAEQWTPDEIAIVHCVQRCVRRAFLAGVDPLSGQDYSYRREWIRRRLEALASVFGIDVLTYAIMSNHLHVILRTRPDVVAQWSDREVAIRWLRLFPGHRLEEHLGEPTDSDVAALLADPQRLDTVRRRLSDISWLMRALCEPIARMANRQDDVTGRFWEGRFKAQRLTDEAGLLACAMYVDLNPVRAAMASQPSQAPFTSAYDRIQAQQGQTIASAAYPIRSIPTEQAGEILRTHTSAQIKQRRQRQRRNPTGQRIARDGWLAPLSADASISAADPQVHRGGVRASDKGFLMLSWEEYRKLLEWVAAQKSPLSGHGGQSTDSTKSAESAVHSGGASGKPPAGVQGVLAKLGIDAGLWCDVVWNFGRYFGRSTCAGRSESMSRHAERTGRRWARGQRLADQCFSSPPT